MTRSPHPNVGLPRSAALCLLLGFAVGGPARAATPSTAPADESFSTLIDQLGDDDFTVREAASAKLLAAGPAAKPALQEASSSPDPERRTRAADLLKRLTVRPLPGLAPPGTPDTGLMQVHMDNEPNGRVVDLTVGGRTTHVEQGPDGADIRMTVRGYINGQRVTEVYNARDPAALKALSPDAYKLWQQLGGTSNRLFLNPGNNVMVVNDGLAVVGGGGDDLTKLSQDIVRQMLNTKLTEAQRLTIMQQIQRVRLAKDAETGAVAIQPAPGDKPVGQNPQDAYLKECDALRKQLAAAGLPDPGPALPPPAGARLGVTVADSAGIQGVGLTIGSVEDGSRGKKLGLQAGDLIHAVNGRAVNDIADLRTAVTNNAKLELSVTRAGQEITLRENPPATAPVVQ